MDKYDITRHKQYESHIKNYIKKSACSNALYKAKSECLRKTIKLKPVLTTPVLPPLEKHPDFNSFIENQRGLHREEINQIHKDYSLKLELCQLKLKAAVSRDINLHPDYPKLVKSYTDKLKNYKCPACSQKEYAVKTSLKIECPTGYNTFI